jgi:hypothetical protein
MNNHLADLPLWADEEAQSILVDLCNKHNVPKDVFEELVQLQREMQSKDRRRGINDAIFEILARMD